MLCCEGYLQMSCVSLLVLLLVLGIQRGLLLFVAAVPKAKTPTAFVAAAVGENSYPVISGGPPSFLAERSTTLGLATFKELVRV